MNYKGQLPTGEEVFLESNRHQTRIHLQSDDASEQQSQGTSFETGKWSTAPTLFAAPDGVVVKLEVAKEPVFVEIKSDGIRPVDGTPSLDNAQIIDLKVTGESPASTSIDMKYLAL